MGQSASSIREREEFLHRDSRRFSQLVRERQQGGSPQPRGVATARGGQGTQSHLLQPLSRQASRQSGPQPTRPLATFSRQISAQSIPVGGILRATGNGSTREEVLYEQDMPLVNMEDLGMRDGPITHITASPMPRRPSLASRLGSRFLLRHTSGELSRHSRTTYEDGGTHGRTVSSRFDGRSQDEGNDHDSHRFSVFGSLSPPSSILSGSRRRTERAPISRPFPVVADNSSSTIGPADPRDEDRVSISPASLSIRSVSGGSRHTSLGRSRFSRVRRSISTPFEAFFSSLTEPPSRDRDVQNPPQRPLRDSQAEGTDYLLPPLTVTSSSIDIDLSGPVPANREQRGHTFPTVAEPHARSGTTDSARTEALSWAERLAGHASGSRREGRRMPNLLRGRSSRIIRRDDEGPLHHILQLAAAAIAAQLSGAPEQAMTGLQPLGPDGLDGSLNTLFRSLRDATSSIPPDGNASRTLPPMNYMRVFRFDSGAAGPIARRTNEDQSTIADDTEDGSDGRTVTLVMVGVRSVPTGNIGHDDAAVDEPSLNALLSLPIVPSTNALRAGAGGFLRNGSGRPRFPHRRRASMGGVNTFPANYDSQRHQRTHSSSNTTSGQATPVMNTNLPLGLSESPAGPHPPPSTPADIGLSAYSSATTTPSRRPSSASALQNSLMPISDSALESDVGTSSPIADHGPGAVQQRRRSDSEFARHRELGSGAARRNGVVEPDDSPSQGTRSWLIYVVGTNLSEDHPAFATPSLFTDVRLCSDLVNIHPVGRG